MSGELRPPAGSRRSSGARPLDWFVQTPLPSEHPAFAGSARAPVEARTVSPAKAESERVGQDTGQTVSADPALKAKMDEVDRSLEKLGKVIEQVAEAGATERKRAKEQTVEIGFAVAQELAAGAIGAEPERVASLVGSAMSLLMGEGPFRVRLHPDLFKAMQEKGLLARLVEGSKVTVSPDPGLEESGCVVESDSRKVDAGVQTHLRRLRHLFEQDGGGR